jgi:hypothetical protein
MQDDIPESVHLDAQGFPISTSKRNDQMDRVQKNAKMNENQRAKETTDPVSSPSSSLSSSWSSSFEASSARSFQPAHQHHQQQQPPPKKHELQQQQQSAFSSPLYAKTGVAKRLDESAAAATAATFKQQVNRSADLVPLLSGYDNMKRRLRSLIASTKQYHDAMARMHRARMEVRETRSSQQRRFFVQDAASERRNLELSFLAFNSPY